MQTHFVKTVCLSVVIVAGVLLLPGITIYGILTADRYHADRVDQITRTAVKLLNDYDIGVQKLRQHTLIHQAGKTQCVQFTLQSTQLLKQLQRKLRHARDLLYDAMRHELSKQHRRHATIAKLMHLTSDTLQELRENETRLLVAHTNLRKELC